jgi:acylphosphatase
MDSMRVRFIVRGRVQGVAYRASAVEAALSLDSNMRGWIANRPDGSVEGVIEGERTAVDRFLRWCERGPSSAQVSGVEHSQDASDEALSRFSIRR